MSAHASRRRTRAAYRGIGPVIAYEVEPRQPRRQPGHGVERLQYALASDPVADAQERGPGVTPKVLPRPAGRSRHVPTRRDHQDVAGETLTRRTAPRAVGWPRAPARRAGTPPGPRQPGRAAARGRGRCRPAAGVPSPPRAREQRPSTERETPRRCCRVPRRRRAVPRAPAAGVDHAEGGTGSAARETMRTRAARRTGEPARQADGDRDTRRSRCSGRPGSLAR